MSAIIPVVVTVAVVLVSWLAGSIPAAWIATKLVLGKDIRTLGSGNVGATNVFRVLGPKFAISVLLFDFLKGFIPVILIARSSFDFAMPASRLAMLAGAAAVAGHMFPLWLGWRGGKGVATGAGVVSALCPPLFPACLAVFLPVFIISRKMSLASLSAALAVPFLYLAITWTMQQPVDWILAVGLILIPAAIVVGHRGNIDRLIKGTEKKLF